jgi:hypothetical protein
MSEPPSDDDLTIHRERVEGGDVRDGAAGREPLPGEATANVIDDDWRLAHRARRKPRPEPE